MRLVNWAVRDVKLARLAIISHRPPLSLAFRTAGAPSGIQYGYTCHLRCYATISEQAPVGLVVSSELPNSLQPLRPTSNAVQLRRDTAYVQDAATFGKWQWLLNNPQRLAVETDFFRKGPARRWKKQLLVDQLDNYGDFELWSCLLQHLQRLEGDRGVQRTWYAFWGRKSLYQIRTLPDGIFWNSFVEAALRLGDDKFLNSIYLYAEFMGEVYSAKWPNLYTIIIPYFLRTGQYDKAMKWHLQLVPNFYPGSNEFIAMMQYFSTDHTLAASFTLQSIYIASPERRMYDALVPYLYGRGESKLARLWRKVCIKQNDVPRLFAPSRQFLRYLIGYFGKVDLHPREAAAIDAQSQSAADVEEQRLEVSRVFMNQVHGRTFGFTAKSYNDALGSRWFASSWVSLDIAISAVAALGVEQIGPLSLQSICLRAGTPTDVLSRIAQLETAGITVPKSGYVKTIQCFAHLGDTELLTSLLHCDIHPDVFDDLGLQARLMTSSLAGGDLSTYTLLLASRLACIDDSARTAANTLLQTHLGRRNYDAFLNVLDDVRATGIPIDINTVETIFKWINCNVYEHRRLVHLQTLQFVLAVCQRLSSMDIPVPYSCWQKVVFVLGRYGLLDDLFSLTVDLVDHYTTRRSSRPGFTAVNKVDAPEVLTNPLTGVDNLIGLYIPLDTPPSLPMHPLRKIFTRKWQNALIRWSFRKESGRRVLKEPSRLALSGRGTNFELAIGILRKLRESGVSVKIQGVQKALCLRLAELYGTHPVARRGQVLSRKDNSFTLPEMKSLIDAAWGSELLPPLPELEARIRTFDEGYLKRSHEGWLAQKRKWSLQHPSGALRQFRKVRRRSL